MKDLKKQGFDDIIIHNSNAYSIDTSLISCDYYDFITRKANIENAYHGIFIMLVQSDYKYFGFLLPALTYIPIVFQQYQYFKNKKS